MHKLSAPSPWLLRWAAAPQPGKTALDLACGSGRHLPHLLELGMTVTGVDRDVAATAPWQDKVEIINADIEAGPWPLEGRRFDIVLVTNYLWRPLLPTIVQSVAPGGWLIYETFATGQESIGRPSRPDFLLQPGELIQACAGLRIAAYEDLYEPGENPRFVQRIAAVRPD
ncbi:class I SAM-dependent methyltransferase [Burkholderiaceae bacterium UC74_6]